MGHIFLQPTLFPGYLYNKRNTDCDEQHPVRGAIFQFQTIKQMKCLMSDQTFSGLHEDVTWTGSEATSVSCCCQPRRIELEVIVHSWCILCLIEKLINLMWHGASRQCCKWHSTQTIKHSPTVKRKHCSELWNKIQTLTVKRSVL